MQLPAIEEARALGLHCIVSDKNPEVPGASIADEFLAVDLRDPQGILAELARRGRALLGVFTAGTDFSLSVAIIANALGLPGISPESARAASDKALMRRSLAAAGIRGPLFLELRRDGFERSTLDRFLSEVSFPLVVKPADNMGSRGVRKLESQEGLGEAIEGAFRYSVSGRIILEEFIKGPEYSIDTLFWKGELLCWGIATRHVKFPPYFVEMGHSIPSDLEPEQEAKVLDLMRNVASALSIRDGALKGDIFWGPDGPIVGEVAARLSGGYMSGWTLPYAYGFNITRAAIRIACGQDPDLTVPDSLPGRSSVERAVVSFPGLVKTLRELGEIRGLPGFRNWFPRTGPGKRMSFPRNNVEKAGNFIFSGEDLASTARLAQTACARLLIELDPQDGQSIELLKDPSLREVPQAYPSGMSWEELGAENPLAWDFRPWVFAQELLAAEAKDLPESEFALLRPVLRRYGLQASLILADILRRDPKQRGEWAALIHNRYREWA